MWRVCQIFKMDKANRPFSTDLKQGTWRKEDVKGSPHHNQVSVPHEEVSVAMKDPMLVTQKIHLLMFLLDTNLELVVDKEIRLVKAPILPSIRERLH